MRQLMRLSVVAATFLVVMPRYGLAQGASTASISGVVRDSSGAVLPGVTIEAASPALIEQSRSAVTNGEGQFRIPELRTGVYTVTFSLIGFSTLKRTSLDLPPNFTAVLNVELQAGGVQETVTVSSASPQVDAQNITQQTTISRALLDSLPTGKSVLGYLALMPAAVVPSTAQDVGGSMGELSVRASVHGGRQTDQRQLQDGMSFNLAGTGGTARGFYVNPLATQEIIIDTGSGGSAEYALGGAIINLIPKDGGNRLSGTTFLAGTNHSLQANNLDDELRGRGLTSVNGVRYIYDANLMLGGPLRQNKLWFMTSHRAWGRRARFANLYRDADTADWIFTPDQSRPGDAGEDFRADNVRLTWQAATRHKFTFSYDYQNNRSNVQGGTLSSGTRSLEAITNPDVYCLEPKLTQTTWSFVASPKLLFEAGGSALVSFRDQLKNACGGDIYAIAVREQSTGLIYHGSGNRQTDTQYQSNGRFSMTYLRGHHNVKAGVTLMRTFAGRNFAEFGTADLPVAYTFNNSQPTSLTEYVSPYQQNPGIKADLGIFLQDQWTRSRVTVKAGLRYSYFNAFQYATDSPALVLGPGPTHYPESDCLPCWHDVDPRIGLAWDIFGTGRTALKSSFGRYVNGLSTALANSFGSMGSIVSSTTRSWTDTNGNFYPDCNLSQSPANGECGAMANSSFGQSVPASSADPSWVKGWSKRDYNWVASVSLDHQLRPGIAVSVGYFRRWYGNKTVNDNLLVTPADYDPYCITAPTDPRLGSSSGSQICGLYDVTPAKFGQVFTERTLAKNFGHATEIFNGVDAIFDMRLPHGGRLNGGWSVGNTINTATVTGLNGLSLGTNSRINNCFVVDSPQQLYNCESRNPYQSQLKVSGSHPLPGDFQAAFVLQSLPGTNYGADYAIPTAAIQPSLGRPLAGGTRNVTLTLLPLDSAFLDRTTQLDLRMSKKVRIGNNRLQANLDLYNVFNGNNVLNVNSTYGPSWLTPTQILDARFAKFSLQLDF